MLRVSGSGEREKRPVFSAAVAVKSSRYAAPFDVTRHCFVNLHNSGRHSDWPFSCSSVLHFESQACATRYTASRVT